MDLTTYIVDDDEAVRQSLVLLLRANSLRARAFASAAEFLEQLGPDISGCVVTDVRMPEIDGLSLVKRLRETGRLIPIIMITGYADVPLAVQAMKAGASDFIEKPYDSEIMLRSIGRALAHSEDQNAKQAELASMDRRVQRLTEREHQVFLAVAEGFSNKAVAQMMSISPRTVEIHRANVMHKLKADGLSELVRIAIATQDSAANLRKY